MQTGTRNLFKRRTKSCRNGGKERRCVEQRRPQTANQTRWVNGKTKNVVYGNSFDSFCSLHKHRP